MPTLEQLERLAELEQQHAPDHEHMIIFRAEDHERLPEIHARLIAEGRCLPGRGVVFVPAAMTEEEWCRRAAATQERIAEELRGGVDRVERAADA